MAEINEEKIKQAEAEVERLIASGAPIANMDIFNILDTYQPSERIKNLIDFTIDEYMELVNKLNELPDDLKQNFLEFLKQCDIRDNQKVEKEDMFMISFNAQYNKKFAIDELLGKYSNILTSESFERIHDLLLYGSSSSDKIGYRVNNLKFVGKYDAATSAKFKSGNRVVEYFPIDYKQIRPAVDRLLDYYNHNFNAVSNKYDALIKPMTMHGLVAALQLFQDGNTRYGRLYQSVEMFGLLNKLLGIHLPLPIVYATRQYEAYRDTYRNLVKYLVINNTTEAWEEWFKFNLQRIQDAIWYNSNKLEQIKNIQRR